MAPTSDAVALCEAAAKRACAKGMSSGAQSPVIVDEQKQLSLSTSHGPEREKKKVLDFALRIETAPLTGDDIQFMHSIFCQVGLPRSRVKGNQFERRSGDVALLVEAGKLWDGREFVQQPVPYGAMPRLMLAWMNTYAVRYKTPEIPIGESASEFLRMLGKDTSGGKKGTFTTFRTQIQALSACRMTLGYNVDGCAHTYAGTPIKQFAAWLNDNGHKGQRPLWPGLITFSDEYFKTLSVHAVPIDLRALMALQGSSLAMDIYCWLAERLHRIHGRPVVLHWVNLREQFAQEYVGKNPDKDFKKKFLPALRAVLTVYPKAKVKSVRGGLLLQSSPPPIPYRDGVSL